MKVFNFGNDYVYQQKQQPIKPIAENKVIDATNQIQTGGEREINSAPEATKASKARNKKENREETKTDNSDDSDIP